MKYRFGLMGLVAVFGFWAGGELAACGDKFLVVGRGTRFQRPKNARAASVLIYSSPSSGLPAALRSLPVDSVLRQAGHRSTSVETPDQLSSALASGRFDVVLAASSDALAVERLVGSRPDAPVVLVYCLDAENHGEREAGKGSSCNLKTPPKERPLLDAIDQAVERHDLNAKNALSRS